MPEIRHCDVDDSAILCEFVRATLQKAIVVADNFRFDRGRISAASFSTE
jgi:hypothetical protein